MNRIVAITVALSLLAGHAQGVQAKKKKKADLTLVKKDSVNTDYKKIVTGAQVRRGLFTVIFKEKEGKLYFELPDTAFQKTYMLSNRIASTSDTQDYVAGQMVTTPFLISFTKDELSRQTLNDFAVAIKNAKDPNTESAVNVKATFDATNDSMSLYNSNSGASNKISLKANDEYAAQLLNNGGAVFLSEGVIAVLLKGRRQRVSVPRLEENKIFGRRAAAILFHGIVNAVFPCHPVKVTDILIIDLNIGYALVLTHKLLDGLFSHGLHRAVHLFLPAFLLAI